MNGEEEIPLENQFTAADDLIERQRRIFANNKEFSTTLYQLQKDSIRVIHSVIGSANLERYTAFHKENRKRMADIPTLFARMSIEERRKREKEYRLRYLAEAGELFKRLNLDKRKIESTQKDYIARAQSAIVKYMEPKEEAPYVYISPEEAPKHTSNPWTWKFPPYNGEWGWWWSGGSWGGRWVTHAENRATGGIGCWSNMWLYGADDSDYSYTNALSEIWVWFKMPVAGLVEAWIYLQAIDANYGGCMEDEFGISDADVRQKSMPYLEVFSPQGGRRYGTLLDYHIGECDCCWSGKVANPGDFRYAHLFSTDSYATGQWVLMAIGIHDYNYFWVNDESCDTHMTNRYFVHHIALRSTGAP